MGHGTASNLHVDERAVVQVDPLGGHGVAAGLALLGDPGDPVQGVEGVVLIAAYALAGTVDTAR